MGAIGWGAWGSVSKYGAWVRRNIFKGCTVTKKVEEHWNNALRDKNVCLASIRANIVCARLFAKKIFCICSLKIPILFSVVDFFVFLSCWDTATTVKLRRNFAALRKCAVTAMTRSRRHRRWRRFWKKSNILVRLCFVLTSKWSFENHRLSRFSYSTHAPRKNCRCSNAWSNFEPWPNPNPEAKL